ncbi:MAG: HYR domain-containing protein [Dyadobacter sp.]|uniref:HYR domain-containing protein n=1 Tax=Dyadobacter sp. TaxID=1914288 RepID=UPI0032676802
MKKSLHAITNKLRPLGLLLLIALTAQLNALANDVTYTTEPLAAGNVTQGTNNFPFYILKLDATTAVTVQTINATTAGTYTADDAAEYRVYANTTNSMTGATFIGNNGIAPAGNGETISFTSLGYNVPAGETRYFFMTVSVSATAADGHTFKINGAANPIAISYGSASPLVTNSQTDAAGAQTVKAPPVTYSTEPLAASDILQGTINVPFYALKLSNGAFPVTLQTINATTIGTYTATDVLEYRVYANTTNSLSGATFIGNNGIAPSGNGETISFTSLGYNVPANETRYFFMTVYVSAIATNNHTIKIDGSANPIAISYASTSPLITNSQTDAAGAQTFKAPTVAYSTEFLAPSNVLPGTSNVIFYALKLTNGAFPVTLQAINATTTGTYTGADVIDYRVFANTSNSMTGATVIGNNGIAPAGNGETISFTSLGYNVPAGETRYFFITLNVSATAVDGHTIKINGSANSIAANYGNTTPIATNSQTDIAGKQTIGTPSFTYTTENSPAKIIARGTSDHPFYTLKLALGGTGATVTNLTATTSGTYNTTDITSFSLYKNSVPGIAGATLLATDATSTGSGETLNFDTGYLELDANTTTYLIVRANINAAATPGNTFQINGGSNPIFIANSGVTASITNNQTNIAGVQTIGIPPAFSPALTDLTATTDAGLCTALKTYSIGTTGYPTPTITYVFSGATTGNGAGSGTGSVFNKGVTTVELTASNGCDPVAVQTFTITVSDTQAPSLTVSPNISTTTTPSSEGWGCTGLVAIPNAVFSDKCPGIGQLSWSMTGDGTGTGVGQIPSYRYSLGVTTITYSIADAAGNIKTASLTVTITDNENPTITAPANVNAFTNTNCTATGVALGTPVTTDNCSVTSVVNDAPSIFPLGTTTFTWTVTDGSGNTKTATQTVTVTDNVKPTITAPAAVNTSINTACTATGVVLGTATAADNCTASPTITNNAPTTFPLGATTVTWTATDAAGNTETATQIVTVTDNVNPTITAPTAVTLSANTSCTATEVVLGNATAADNCTASPIITNNAPSVFPIGATTVTWTATDASGNIGTATQVITITDDDAPVQPVLADITGSCSVTPPTPTTTDGCAGTVNGVTTTIFPITQLGTTVITWTFSDGSGNSVTADQNVIVSPSTAIAPLTTSASLTIVAGDNYFQDADCKLVAKITVGTISGLTTSRVWVEEANVTGPYVRRHYQITPGGTNAENGTDVVTLYFTQAEFDAYSSAVTAKLPANATDAAGKANLRIAKFPGSSTDLGGLVYASSPVEINPSDANIVFVNGHWEVTFPVTGFSGFFVNTVFTPLPVTLISFNGKRAESGEAILNWVTADEKYFDRFEVQKSLNAKSFETIGTINGQSSGNTALRSYGFTDAGQSAPYYRLKMVDDDGTYQYSKIINIQNGELRSVVGQFYPNPAVSAGTFIDIVAAEAGNWTIKSYDLSGRELKSESQILKKGLNKVKVNAEKLLIGISLIRFENKDQIEVRKLVR